MHSVDRGPEPVGLEQIRATYTPRWVQHYRDGIGPRPSDSRWRSFHNDLRERSGGLCFYCEERSRGEIDHFRPKSLHPELVYSWPNWLFACHSCNNAKGEKWPPGGYVNPCAKSNAAQPEQYFTFDTETGEILPKVGLSPRRRLKALRMIEDLRLNEWHHLKNRVGWLWMISKAVPSDHDSLTPDVEEQRSVLVSRITQHSSIARAWLSERGHQIKT